MNFLCLAVVLSCNVVYMIAEKLTGLLDTITEFYLTNPILSLLAVIVLRVTVYSVRAYT